MSETECIIAALAAETYEDWVRRFCADRNIPWRPEYAIPVEDAQTPQPRKAASNG